MSKQWICDNERGRKREKKSRMRVYFHVCVNIHVARHIILHSLCKQNNEMNLGEGFFILCCIISRRFWFLTTFRRNYKWIIVRIFFQLKIWQWVAFSTFPLYVVTIGVCYYRFLHVINVFIRILCALFGVMIIPTERRKSVSHRFGKCHFMGSWILKREVYFLRG